MNGTSKLFCRKQNHAQRTSSLCDIKDLSQNRGIFRSFFRRVFIKLINENDNP